MRYHFTTTSRASVEADLRHVVVWVHRASPNRTIGPLSGPYAARCLSRTAQTGGTRPDRRISWIAAREYGKPTRLKAAMALHFACAPRLVLKGGTNGLNVWF
jgi:hypothetical protein